MAKHSKRFLADLAKVDRNKYYQPDEALDLVKSAASAKFDETVEVHLRMGVDPRYSDQQVRGVVTLPNGTGRTVRILVFAGPDGQVFAREAGADFVGGDELADQIMKGWTDFDVVLATPDMMRVVGKLGKVLGPRGLMPSPKTGTIVPPEDLPRVIRESRLGRVEFRVDKTSNIHVPIGKASFSKETLMQNLAALMEALMAAKPASVKGIYVHRVTLASTMGPGVKTEVAATTALKQDSVAAA
ncbi:MAG: 50S ribosomal protein L1 [Anaerolineales bacterium]|nr:50S ribosomal protein L1 [Anaerolineales bacterium]